MSIVQRRWSFICTNCIHSRLQQIADVRAYGRTLTTSITLPQQVQASAEQDGAHGSPEAAQQETPAPEGRMSARLAQLTEVSIEQGGQSAKKAVEEAGFSEELKWQLEARIQQSAFKSENAAAFAQANMPVCLPIATIAGLIDTRFHSQALAKGRKCMLMRSRGRDKSHYLMQR